MIVEGLISKIEEYFEGRKNSVYELKRKLLGHYGENIIIDEKGQSDIVTLRETANEIL